MERVLDTVARYYARKLAEHGPTPRGVDWNSEASQELRFTELLRVCGADRDASLIDFGCGYGALAARLRRDGFRGPYCGYDVSEEMVAAARRAHGSLDRCAFTSRLADVAPADYTLASGIFNVKLETAVEEWEQYARETLDTIARLSRFGFAFNVLTAWSDPERRRDDLYYADPSEWLSYCLGRFGRRVALLHDYPLFELTILVRTAAHG